MTTEQVKKGRRTWTQEELQYLKRVYEDSSVSTREMEEILNRKVYCIREKARKLGLKRTNIKPLAYLETGEKICSRCKRVLPLSMFIKRSDCKNAYKSHCRECRSLAAMESKIRKRNKISEMIKNGEIDNYTPPTHKTCKDCNEIKEIGMFYKNSSNKDGYESYCKACSKIRKEKSVLKLLQERGY